MRKFIALIIAVTFYIAFLPPAEAIVRVFGDNVTIQGSLAVDDGISTGLGVDGQRRIEFRTNTSYSCPANENSVLFVGTAPYACDNGTLVKLLDNTTRTVNWGTAIYAPVATMAVNFQWADSQYTIDNVSMVILDNTGKLVTAADNVTAQVFSCSALATPTCDNVTASSQVLGDAISYPAVTTATAHLKDWLQVRITAIGRAATYLTFSVGVIAHATP